ncbi:MAG: hypothetical protein NVS3B21_33000 [Acidimicrobiales bacterium]
MTRRDLFDKQRIEELLVTLGARCEANGITAELFLVGGAAMVLAYGRERMTRDLIAVFEPKSLVYELVHEIADTEGIPRGWLNDAVKGLMPDWADGGEGLAFRAPGISVAIASPEYLFAMKALAARQEADGDDLTRLARIVGITTSEQAFAVIERYYRPDRLTAKGAVFVQRIIGSAHSPVSDGGDDHEGKVYVSGHVRNGRPVVGRWRNPPRRT